MAAAPQPDAGQRFLFASESVTEGHPDKLCDLVAEAVLDACLAQDAEAKVSCEACTKTNMVMVLGEVVTKATVNYEQTIREAVKSVGYDDEDKGLDSRTANVIVALDEQTPDLAQAITAAKATEDASTGDQGVVFGYATDESPEMMPVSHVLASKLCAQLDKARKAGTLSWAKPTARAQVVVEYQELAGGGLSASRVHSVTMTCAQPAAASGIDASQAEDALMEHVVRPVLPPELCDGSTIYHLGLAKNIAASAVSSDTGLAGRKHAADTYGGWACQGSSGLSGKDASKVCRTAAYGARWAAKSLVASKLCRRCLVQLSYFPNAPGPVAVYVNSYGSAAGGRTDAELAEALRKNFDFRIGSLQQELQLKRPQFQRLAAYGHFGRPELDLAWEKPKALSIPTLLS